MPAWPASSPSWSAWPNLCCNWPWGMRICFIGGGFGDGGYRVGLGVVFLLVIQSGTATSQGTLLGFIFPASSSPPTSFLFGWKEIHGVLFQFWGRIQKSGASGTRSVATSELIVKVTGVSRHYPNCLKALRSRPSVLVFGWHHSRNFQIASTLGLFVCLFVRQWRYPYAILAAGAVYVALWCTQARSGASAVVSGWAKKLDTWHRHRLDKGVSCPNFVDSIFSMGISSWPREACIFSP